jgi:hypothetical protein
LYLPLFTRKGSRQSNRLKMLPAVKKPKAGSSPPRGGWIPMRLADRFGLSVWAVRAVLNARTGRSGAPSTFGVPIDRPGDVPVDLAWGGGAARGQALALSWALPEAWPKPFRGERVGARAAGSSAVGSALRTVISKQVTILTAS